MAFTVMLLQDLEIQHKFLFKKRLDGIEFHFTYSEKPNRVCNLILTKSITLYNYVAFGTIGDSGGIVCKNQNWFSRTSEQTKSNITY